MYKTLNILMLSAVFSAVCVAQDPDWHKPVADVNPVAVVDEATLLEIVMKSGEDNAALMEKMYAYKKLGTHGTAKAAAVLVTRFEIDKEGFYARYAAETIPGDEVDVVLCNAIKNFKKPEVIAGTLTTLGVRAGYFGVGSTSTATAKEYLNHENADVRKAAAYAFACCAGEKAIELFADNGETDKSLKIYDALAAANFPNYQKQAALFWATVLRGGNAIPMLVEQLNAENAKLFAVGLKAGRELPPGSGASQAMIEQLDKQADPYRKSLLVCAIGDRNDHESKRLALPVMIEQANTENDEKVRIAAIEALKKVGDASALPILIAAANETKTVTTDGNTEILPTSVAVAAQVTLVSLPGKEVDDAIVKLLESSDASTKVAAIKLVEQRRIASAFPLLKQGLKDEHAEVREASLKAVGQNATLEDFPDLLAMLVGLKDGDNVENILVVLKSAGTRMPQENVADLIDKQFKTASTEMCVHLLELLKEIGGPKAMNIVEQAAWGEDAKLRDQATAILGAWPPGKTEDLPLLAATCKKIATEMNDARLQRRGLRSYIRLARQFNMPEEQRLKIAADAMALATQPEDKQLVLEAYGRWPSLRTLETVLSFADDAQLQQKACEEAVKIAEKLPGKDAKVVTAMTKVVATTDNADLKDRAQRILDKQ